MTLFRAIHATKVLALAGLFLATTIIPPEARDWGGSHGVQMRTNHVRMNAHRLYPRYEHNRMGYRNGWSHNRGPRRDWMADGGLPEPQIRTRHNRLPRYRSYDGHDSERWGRRGGWVRDRAGREIWSSADRRHDARRRAYDGLPEPEIRTRHNRVRQYRPYPDRYVERWGNGGGWIRDRGGRQIWTSGGGRRYGYGQGGYGGDDFPDTISGIGTYAGGISAYSDPGNGIYINVEGNYVYDDGEYTQPPQGNRGRIINVTPKNMNSSCAYENGVCVIRR